MSRNKLPDLTKETDYRELLRSTNLVPKLLASSEFSSANYYKQDDITCSEKERQSVSCLTIVLYWAQNHVSPLYLPLAAKIKKKWDFGRDIR